MKKKYGWGKSDIVSPVICFNCGYKKNQTTFQIEIDLLKCHNKDSKNGHVKRKTKKKKKTTTHHFFVLLNSLQNILVVHSHKHILHIWMGKPEFQQEKYPSYLAEISLEDPGKMNTKETFRRCAISAELNPTFSSTCS